MQFLQVKHTGKVKGSLFLSDVSGQDNKKQGSEIPQYVPENGTLNLPLTDLVVLSFSQGCIAGFVKEGLVTASVVDSELPFDYEGPVEVWVSTLGDDTNSGSKASPFRTIRKAMDVAYSIASWKHMKTVNIVSQTQYFYETMLVNTPKWHFKAWRGATEGRVDITSDPKGSHSSNTFGPTEEGYPLTVAPISREGYRSFVSGTLVGCETDNNELTYTGPPVLNLDIHPDWVEIIPHQIQPFYAMDVKFEGLAFANRGTYIASTTNGPAVVMFAPNRPQSQTRSILQYVTFENSVIQETSPRAGVGLYVKNVNLSTFDKVLMGGSQAAVFEDSSNCYFSALDLDQSPSDIIIAQKSNPYEIHSTFATLDIRAFRNLTAYSDRDTTNMVKVKHLNFTGEISLHGASSFSTTEVHLPSLSTKDLNHHSTGQMRIVELNVFGNLTKTGTGILNVQKTSVKGSVAISGGTDNTLTDGTIQGDLTVSNGANIDLTNIVVKGNVDVSGAGTVTWKGGSFYGSVTDPDTKLGTSAAGDWLNVG